MTTDTVSLLDPMLAARSVAVVGASPRPGSVGEQAMAQILGGGFSGKVMPVTPSHREVAGLATVPRLGDLDSPPDLVVLAVGDARLEEQLLAAGEIGARAAVAFSPALGLAAGGEPLRERLAAIATAAGIPLCGPNGMGFLNLEQRLRVCGFHQPFDLEAGPVAFLSHSGSLFSAMLHNRRGLRFNLVVSSGLELVTTMDAYLHYVLQLPSTRVVGMFLETVRNPQSMARALELAAGSAIPVVALKVGRTGPGKEAVATHSGALAGEDGIYQAFFEAHRVITVDTMDEMADALDLFSSPRRPRPGGLGSVHDSGGERTMLIDQAGLLGVPLAAISPVTSEKLAAVLDAGLEPNNPVDAWGTGHDAEAVFAECLRALAADPAVGLVAFSVDLTAEADPAAGYASFLAGLAPELDVPLVVLAHLSSGIDPAQAAALRSAGVPVLEGTATGLRAIGSALAYVASIPPPGPSPEIDRGLVEQWRARLAAGPPGPAEVLELLADYGIPVAAPIVVTGAAEAVAAWARIGRPVAMKTTTAAHKTEVGGVHLGLATAEQVDAAYRDLADRLGPEVMVQPMVDPGVELALGVVRDVQFGPVVMIGAGGTLVEVVADRVWAMPPIFPSAATKLISRLKVARLLAGFRGGGPVDAVGAAEAVVRLSLLARDLGDLFAGLDVNPLVVNREGAVAVDGLLVGERP
jgi:acyl-CoA synthetase (NDP forming)